MHMYTFYCMYVLPAGRQAYVYTIFRLHHVGPYDICGYVDMRSYLRSYLRSLPEIPGSEGSVVLHSALLLSRWFGLLGFNASATARVISVSVSLSTISMAPVHTTVRYRSQFNG